MHKEMLVTLAEQMWLRVGRDSLISTEILDTIGKFPFNIGDQPFLSVLRQTAVRELQNACGSKASIPVEEVDDFLAEQSAALHGVSRTPEGEVFCCGAVRWAGAGYPEIQIGHKYAASLMVTNVSMEVLKEVHIPFPAFLLELPSGLLHIDDETEPSGLRELKSILVTRLYNRLVGESWAYIALTESTISFWRFGYSTEDIVKGEYVTHFAGDPAHNPLAIQITDRDERVAACIGRLILNVCLAMSDPANVADKGMHRVGSTHNKTIHPRLEKLPTTRVFRVGKPVVHDFREAVGAYIRGDAPKRSLNVQTLVAGYWRMQPYGPGNSKRRPQRIEAFWRGPEDAPIVQRAHVLKMKES